MAPTAGGQHEGPQGFAGGAAHPVTLLVFQSGLSCALLFVLPGARPDANAVLEHFFEPKEHRVLKGAVRLRQVLEKNGESGKNT